MARLIVIEDSSELAQLIASAARLRGHQAHVAPTGKMALAMLSQGHFGAAVVDLLLPDMRGSEVLSALRLRNVPAIAVSGVFKGDQFAQEAIEVYGAAAFFEKPFPLEALLDAVDRFAGAAQPSAFAAAQREQDALEELEIVEANESSMSGEVIALEEVVEDEIDEEIQITEEHPTESPAESDIALQVAAEAAETAELALPPPLPADPPTTEALPRPEVWERAESRRRAPDWIRSGEIREGTVPKLLNAYFQARYVGELRLKQAKMVKVVFFENGHPIYAASNLGPERFARFTVRKGSVKEEDLAAVYRVSQSENLRTGEAMVKLQLISAERRLELLREQVKEIIWSTFHWTSGLYEYSPRRPAAPDLVKLSLFPGDLILEGVGRTMSLVALRQKMGLARKLFPTADPPYQLHEIKLSGDQALLLAYSDGTKSVEDLLQLTDLTEKEALATLHGLELLGLIEERAHIEKRQRITFGL